MKLRVILSVTLLLSAFTLRAQSARNDMQSVDITGDIKSVLVQVTDAAGHIKGQPLRYIFNDKASFDHIHYYDTSGNLALAVHYQYDKKGVLVTDNRLTEPYSQLVGVTNYSYDKKKRILTGETLAIDDTIGLKTVYTYDKNGDEISVQYFDEQGVVQTTTKKIYKNHLPVLELNFEGPSDWYRGEVCYRYDSDGHLIEEVRSNLNQVTLRLLFSYVFDQHGNWVKRRAYHITPTSASLWEVTTRTISYSE